MTELRRDFLADHAAGAPLDELLRIYNIGRSAAYELIRRARLEGVEEAVAARSRAPHRRPTTLSPDVVERVLSLRQRFRWGPKKLWALYVAEHGQAGAPSVSSIGNILKANGDVRPYRRRRRPATSPPLSVAVEPNDVWATDYKGAMRRLRVEPLNVIDLASRFWVGCAPLVDKTYGGARGCFERWFTEFGAPKTIRVDAGNPWYSMAAPCGLTRLSAWWIALGIRVERAETCQLNGCIERLHGTMEREMDTDSDVDVRHHFEAQRTLYNTIRPHEALGQTPPSSHFRRSSRLALERVHDPVSGGCDEVRHVDKNGCIRWLGRQCFITEALAGRTVGLRQQGRESWSVRYFELELGHLEGDTFKSR